MAKQSSFFRSVSRLYPHVKPVLPRLIMGLLSAFLAGAGPVMVYGFRFRTRFSKVARRSQDQAGDLATTVEESVHGIRVLKAFGRSREALETFNGQAEELRQTEIEK